MNHATQQAEPLTETPIFHITEQAIWEQCQGSGEYRPASLAAEGFVHLSTAAQVAETANRFFRAQTGLVLLVIDPARLVAPLRFEPAPDRNGEAFPHLFGPLNTNAVARVLPFSPSPDGTFLLPDEVSFASAA